MKNKNKITRPIWYRYLRVQRKYGISWKAATNVAIISFIFLLANGFLQDGVANKEGFLNTFARVLGVLSIAPFYRRIEVYAQGIGLIILIVFGALGFALGTLIF